MTDALMKAFATAAMLPGWMQDQLAAELTQEVRGEVEWDRALARSQGKLEVLAARARLAKKAGRTQRLEFDEIE